MGNKEFILHTRSDSNANSNGNGWCSPEYMSAKMDLSFDVCHLFLTGPENSKAHGLWMTKEQATLFSNTDLSAKAERKALS